LAGRTVRIAGIRSAGRAPELAQFITESQKYAEKYKHPAEAIWSLVENRVWSFESVLLCVSVTVK
jgi:hypothetical protein